jgi:energy-coupling factor transport system substrate-specific component
VQPCTFIILITGYVFGETAGFMVGAETAFLSNFLLGQGPWTPWQMLAWGLAGILGALFRRAFYGGRYELYIFVALGIAMGYLFGLLMNIWYWLAYTYPHTLAGFILIESLSLPFDTLHAVGNAIFIQLFAMRFIKTLEKYKKRYGIFTVFGAEAVKEE